MLTHQNNPTSALQPPTPMPNNLVCRRRCVHLTNYSVNKKSEKFVANAGDSEDAESHGSKWSLTALHARIEEERGEGAWRRVWRQVRACRRGANCCGRGFRGSREAA